MRHFCGAKKLGPDYTFIHSLSARLFTAGFARGMDFTAIGPYTLNVRTNIMLLLTNCEVHTGNIRTAVWMHGPNEVRSVRKTKVEYFPIWTELIGQ